MMNVRVVERRAMVALAGRESRRIASLWTQTILAPSVTALLLLAVFGGALGDRIRTTSDLDYAAFIVPGLLVMTVAGQAFANSSTSLFQAKSEGYLEDVLTSPLRPWQLVLAYVSGGVVRGLAAAGLVAVVGVPVAGTPERPVLTLAALALTAVAFAGLGVITGVLAQTFDQHSFVANVVVTPLALVGGVFYSAESLSEPWETLTRLDPIFYLVDLSRGGLTGVHETSTWISLATAAVATAALLALATAVLASSRQLRP